MVTALQVRFNPDPTGTFTVQVMGKNASGEIVIGLSGGVPSDKVASEVTRITSLLDIAQAHVSTLYQAPEKESKEVTSQQIKA